MRPNGLVIWMLLWLAVDLTYAVARPLHFEEARRLAWERNPSVLIAQAKVKEAEGRVREARAALLPHLSGSANYNHAGKLRELELPFAMPGMNQVRFPMGYENTYQAGVTVRQPLFAWGRFWNLYRQAQLGLEAARLGEEVAKRQVELDVTRAFYGALLAEKLVEVAQASLKQVEAHLHNAEKMREAGVATDYDVLRAQVQRTSVQTQLVQAQNALRLARSRLRQVLQWEGEPLEPVGDFTIQPIAWSLEECLRIAEEQNPQLAQLRKSEAIAQKGIAVAKTGNKPSLTLVGNYQYEAYSDPLDRESWNNVWNVALSLNVPLFDGLATSGQVKQAQAALEQAQVATTQAAAGVRTAVEAAFLNLKQAEAMLTLQKDTVHQAQEGLRLIQLRYQNGLATSVEVLDAQVALTRAKVSHYQAQHDYLIARAALLNAMGKPVE